MKNAITNNGIKGVILIFFLSISLLMMKTTTYIRALGDYVLEFFGLKSWSGNNYMGMHWTVIYFGVLTIILLAVVLRFAEEEWKIKKRWIFLLVIVFVKILSFITDAAVIKFKKNADGLRTISFNLEKSKMEYELKDMKYANFLKGVEIII